MSTGIRTGRERATCEFWIVPATRAQFADSACLLSCKGIIVASSVVVLVQCFTQSPPKPNRRPITH